MLNDSLYKCIAVLSIYKKLTTSKLINLRLTNMHKTYYYICVLWTSHLGVLTTVNVAMVYICLDYRQLNFFKTN